MAVWLAAIAVSIPAAFVAAYFVVAKWFEASWQRVVLGALFGFILAPFALYAAFLLPLTVFVIAPLILVCWLVHVARRRHRPIASEPPLGRS